MWASAWALNSPKNGGSFPARAVAPTLAGHVTAFYNCLSNLAGVAVPLGLGRIVALCYL